MNDEYDDILKAAVKPRPVKRTSYDEDAALDLISQHESGGRNIKQNVVPAGGGFNPSVGRVTGPSTASGPWQITNSTWRKRAPREIAQKYPSAMSAPVDVQRTVARKIYRETGFQDWAPYNASLRRAIARGEQPKNQDPYADILKASQAPEPDDYSDVLAAAVPAQPQVEVPRGRFGAMANASRTQPRRQQPQVDPLEIARQVGGAVMEQRLDRKRPKITSRADIMRAEESPQPGSGTIPRGVDPRLLKGEQPSDPMAYAKAQELVGRVEPQREVGGIRAGKTAMGPRERGIAERIGDAVDPYLRLDRPAGVKSDPIRGAASLGLLDLRREITPEEKLIDPDAEAAAETAYQVGSFAPAVVPYVAAGKVVSKIPSLAAATREAHIARSALTFGGVELGREVARSIQTGEPLNPKEVAISTAIGGSIGRIAGVNPSLKRQIVAFVTPGVVADVARGTDPETATFNALTNLAFGLHSYQKAPREVQNAAKAAVEGAKSDRTTEIPRSVGDVPVQPSERVQGTPVDVGVPEPQLRQWQHMTFGKVTESENQTGIGKGRVRVTAEDGSPHVIKKADLRGAGNQIAIPIKTERELPPEAVAGIERAKEDVRRSIEERRTVPPVVEPTERPNPPLSEPLRVPAENLQSQEAVRGQEPAASPAREAEPTEALPSQPAPKATEGAQPKEVAPRVAEVEPIRRGVEARPAEPSQTAPKDKAMQADRAELGLPELARLPRVSAEEVLSKAKTENTQNPREVDTLVNQALAGGKNFTNVETMRVNLRAQEIKNRVNELNKEIYEATDPEVIAQKRTEQDGLISEFGRISEAQDKAGAEWSRAGTARQRAINQDFDLVSMVARMKKAKGRELNAEEKAKIETQARRITELETKLAEAQEVAKTRSIQKEIDRTMRRARRAESRQTLDAEFETLKAEFAQIKSAQAEGGFFKSERGALDPEAVKVIGRMARNRVRAGITDATQLVDNLHAVVSEHLEGVTKREIRDAISGYGIEGRDRRAEWAKQLAEIRSELKQLSGQEDVGAGIRTARRAGPTKGEARKLPMEGPRKSEARSSGIPPQGPKLSEGVGRKEGPQLGPRQGPRLSEGVGKPAGPQLGKWQGPRLREGVGPAEGPSLGSRQGPQMSEARKLPAEGPPRQLFGRNQARLTQLRKEEAELVRRLEERDFSTPEKQAPLPYTRETARLQKQVDELKQRYSRELYRATRSTFGKVSDVLAKSAGVPKTIKSIGDISAVFRQGGFYAITHPYRGLAVPFKDMIQSFSHAGFLNVENKIKSSPKYEQSVKDGVEYTGVNKDDPRLSKHEENYLGDEYIDLLARGRYNVPGKALQLVKDVSERTFISFLDSQRISMYDTMTDGLANPSRISRLMGAKKGLTAEQLKADRKRIAQAINAGTGRGNLGRKGNQAAPLLNVAMFSPRLVASRVQLLNQMFNPNSWARMPRNARAEILQDNVKFLAATAATITLAKAMGGQVSLDPDDSEFLKVRFGDTVYDNLTGLQQPLRYLLNMARAMSPISSKKLQTGESYAGEDKGRMTTRFLRSKASPVAGTAVNYLSGSDYTGRKFSWKREGKDVLTPLPAKDVIDGLQQGGLLGGLLATPTLMGVGVGSYPPSAEKPGTHAEKLARKLVRAKLPDVAREEDEIESDRKVSQLRARARKGENVTQEITELLRAGEITKERAQAIRKARGSTRLMEDVTHLEPEDAVNVLGVASLDERKKLYGVVVNKITNSNAPLQKKREMFNRVRQLGSPRAQTLSP